jgi:hypothetical protein
MADKTTTSFPKMGDEWITDNLINCSGDRSPYTITVGKKTQGRGASPTGVKKNRGASMINEAHGPTFRPVTTLYAQNAAEASATQRNTRIVPSALGDRDFYAARQYSQGNGVV